MSQGHVLGNVSRRSFIAGAAAAVAAGPVASAVVAFMGKKPDKRSLAWAACALAVVGMVICRYAYYAASLF